MMLALLGIVGGFIRQSAGIQKVTEFGERHRVHLQNTLAGIGKEVQDAWSISTPTTGPASELIFTRINGQMDGTRLPSIPQAPNPLPTTFDVLPASAMLTVRYYVSGEEIRRQVSQPTYPTSDAALFGPAAGFSATRLSDNALEITISTQKDLVVESSTIRIVCPCL